MQTVTFDVAPGITAIDTLMAGRDRSTAAYLLHDEEPTIVETGPTTSVEPVTQGLASLGVGPSELANVVLTHIHLDHAGGVGRLAATFPRATIWVHERGAPHLADPAKLIASATRVYGEERMAEWFGPVEAVDRDRLRPVDDGDRIRLRSRDLEVLYTPGHASHHVALVDSGSGAVLTGDALGIHVPDLPVLRSTTSTGHATSPGSAFGAGRRPSGRRWRRPTTSTRSRNGSFERALETSRPARKRRSTSTRSRSGCSSCPASG